MEKELKIKMYSFTLDCINPYALAKFYAELLNWEIPFYDENWACIGVPGMSQGSLSGNTFSAKSRVLSACVAGRTGSTAADGAFGLCSQRFGRSGSACD